MSKVFIDESTLTEIGDAIREKTGNEELIPTRQMAAVIAAISSGVPSINGYAYTSGTMSFEEDQLANVTVNHDDVGEIKAIFLWCENPTTEEVAYKVLSFYIPTDGANRWNNSGSIYFSTAGVMTFGNAANATAHVLRHESNTQFVVWAGASTGGRLLAGKTYHWLVIGGGAA